MDGGAWWATVHGGHKESDTTEQLTYFILYEIQKDGTDESIHREAMEMQTQRTDMDKDGGEQGEGEMNEDIDAYTQTYVNRQPMGICCMTQGNQTGAL